MPIANDILEKIQRNQSDELLLENSDINKKAAEKLVQTLQQNYLLKLVSFSNITMDSKNFTMIMEALCRLPRLEKLYLRNLKLQDPAAKEIAKRLVFFPKLTLLNLADNHISAEGAIALADALQKNDTLLELSLHTNQITDQAAPAFQTLLQINKTLKKIVVSGNQLTDVAAYSLAEGVKNNPILTGFYIANNKISDVGGQHFVQALKNNITITQFDIYDNKLTSASEKAIEECIKRNTTLITSQRQEKTHTVISGNIALLTEITDEEKKALYEETGIVADNITEPSSKGGTKKKILIGEGYFGKLRLARSLNKDKHFMGVKKIKGAAKIKASLSEIDTHRQLSGKPHIIPLYHAVISKDNRGEDVLYLFMKLAGFGNGKFFQRQIAKLPDATQKQICLVHIAHEFLSGIHAMHTDFFYHLDIKPKNFVIDSKGHADIIDFGCAQKLLDGGFSKGNGDTTYYAPERLAKSRLDMNANSDGPFLLDAAKLDAWSAGITLLQLALHRYPFDKVTRDARITYWDATYFAEKLAKIPELRHPAPDSVWALINQLLIIDPKNRLSLQAALQHPVFQKSDYQFASEAALQKAFIELKNLGTPQITLASSVEPLPPKQEEVKQKPSSKSKKKSNYYMGGDSTDGNKNDAAELAESQNSYLDSIQSASSASASVQNTYAWLHKGSFFTPASHQPAMDLLFNNELSQLQATLTQLNQQFAHLQVQRSLKHNQLTILLSNKMEDNTVIQQLIMELQENVLLAIGLREIRSFSWQDNALSITCTSNQILQPVLALFEKLHIPVSAENAYEQLSIKQL